MKSLISVDLPAPFGPSLYEKTGTVSLDDASCDASDRARKYHCAMTATVARIPTEWLADFEAASRRSLELRMRYAFIHTTKPGLDDRTVRTFDTMAAYREWCERTLPSWLGYGRV